MSRIKFRGTLLRVSDQLSNADFDNLKFLCRTVIPNARMEKIVSGLDLFNALEERGKLSPENVDFLLAILNSAGCDTPMRQLSKDGFFSANSVPAVEDAEDYHFHECLLKLALCLTSSQFEEVKFALQPFLSQTLARIYTATELFQLLQQRRIVTSKNMKVLYDVMCEIGRVDLSEVINDFVMKMGKQPYQGEQTQEHPPIQQPASPRRGNALTHPVEATPDERNDRQLKTVIGPRVLAGHETPNSSLSSYPQGGSTGVASGTSLSSLASSASNLSTLSELGNQPSTYSSLSTSHSGLSIRNDGKVAPAPLPVDSHMQYPTGTPLPHVSQYAYAPIGVHHPRFPQDENVEQNALGLTFNPMPYAPIGVHHPRFPQDENVEQNALGLTFNPMERREDSFSSQGSADPDQQLLQDLLQKQQEVATKEEQIQQYVQEIQQLRGQIGSTSRQHQDKESVYVGRIREYEHLLEIMTREVESQRQETVKLHQTLQGQDPVNDEGDFYKMDKTPHGICLIINNHKFYHSGGDDKAHPERGGAHVDQHNLEQTFKYLQYRVEVLENLSSQRMNDTMLEMARRDHSQYDSFICCILTHGEKEVVHGADSEPVNLNDLTGVMKMCSTLRGKPKLFLIQACRGDAEGEAIKLQDDDTQHDAGGGPYSNTIPKEADFFFGFATPTGNAAYRSRRYGSWFISEVCQVFVNNAYKLNLNAMMKKVNNRVSMAYTKDGNKQAPEFVDRLRFQVHFFRFSPRVPGHGPSRSLAGRK